MAVTRHLTRCTICNCTAWTTTSGEFMHSDCKRRRDQEAKANGERTDNSKKTYTVIFCPPDPGEDLPAYRPHAEFSGTEIAEMKKQFGLVPGMTIQRDDGVRFVVDSRYVMQVVK